MSRRRKRPNFSPYELRRLRAFARWLAAIEAAPDAYRLSVIRVARDLAAATGPDADALATSLGGLLFDALEYTPPKPANDDVETEDVA